MEVDIMSEIKILIVDDEPDIRTVVRIPLELRGYSIAEAGNGCEAISYITDHPEVDLILLDIMMPGMSGIETCAKIRGLSSAPILFLTAKTQENDKYEAYASGGDDFLSKPFSQSELLMKVESLIRRYRVYKGKKFDTAESISERIIMDTENHVIFKDGEPLDLTDTEYMIFLYLAKNKGNPVSAIDLYQGVWNEKYLPSSANTIMVHILNLRKKVEDDAANPRIIRTIWGKGYQID